MIQDGSRRFQLDAGYVALRDLKACLKPDRRTMLNEIKFGLISRRAMGSWLVLFTQSLYHIDTSRRYELLGAICYQN